MRSPELQAERDGVFVVSEMLPRESVRQVLTPCAGVPAARRSTSRSGIVNLEAMACETAVVASAVGGIPEVVVDGETGLLVDYTPDDIRAFEAGHRRARQRPCVPIPALAARMGEAGRARAVSTFDWAAIADETVALYESLV